MKLPRRKFLHLAAGAAALPAVWRTARADSYPSRPVHWSWVFPPAWARHSRASDWSTTVGAARTASRRRQSSRCGQLISVPKSSCNAPPDGYTLLLARTTSAANVTLYPNLNFDFIDDIAPVARSAAPASSCWCNPSVPAKTVPEFIAYAKANPGELNMAVARHRDCARISPANCS